MVVNKTKKTQRQRRGKASRKHIVRLAVPRLCVHRTCQHIYAQIISASGDKVLASASSADKELRTEGFYGGNIAAAKKVGELVAQRAKAAGIDKIAFDRSGFKFHGRVKALADAAREGGVTF